MIRKVRSRFHHAPGVAQGADSTAFAGEGEKVVVPPNIAARAGKAMRKDAEFEVFVKGLADKRLWGVVVALPIKPLQPGLEVFGKTFADYSGNPALRAAGRYFSSKKALYAGGYVDVGFLSDPALKFGSFWRRLATASLDLASLPLSLYAIAK